MKSTLSQHKQTFRKTLLLTICSLGIASSAIPFSALAKSFSSEDAFQQARQRLMAGGVSNLSEQTTTTLSGQTEDGEHCVVEVYGLSPIAEFSDVLTIKLKTDAGDSYLFDIDPTDRENNVKVLQNTPALLGLQVEDSNESIQSVDVASNLSIPFMATQTIKRSVTLETENSKIIAITLQENKPKTRCQF